MPIQKTLEPSASSTISAESSSISTGKKAVKTPKGKTSANLDNGHKASSVLGPEIGPKVETMSNKGNDSVEVPKNKLEAILQEAVKLAAQSDEMETDLVEILSEIDKLEEEIKNVDENEKKASDFLQQIQAQMKMRKNLEDHSCRLYDHLRDRQKRQEVISLKSIYVAKQIFSCVTQAEDFSKVCEEWLGHAENATKKPTTGTVGPLGFFDKVNACTEVMRKHFDTHKDSQTVSKI